MPPTPDQPIADRDPQAEETGVRLSTDPDPDPDADVAPGPTPGRGEPAEHPDPPVE